MRTGDPKAAVRLRLDDGGDVDGEDDREHPNRLVLDTFKSTGGDPPTSKVRNDRCETKQILGVDGSADANARYI